MRIDDVLQRIQGEYVEMPGLRLTPAQAQRLWGLERDVCDAFADAASRAADEDCPSKTVESVARLMTAVRKRCL